MASVSSPYFSGGPYQITQGYGPSSLPGEPAAHGVAHFHEGLDIGAPSGTKIIAALAGWVDDLVNAGGFGTYQILHPDSMPGTELIFGHESKQLVGSGHVAAGTPIGLSGSSGYSTGPHVHFQENTGAPSRGFGGSDVNPTAALAGQGGSTDPGLSIPNPADALGAALSGLGNAIGAGVAGAGSAVAAGITGGVTATGHGIAGALVTTEHNARTFLTTQSLALLVAAVVVIVVFMS